MKVTVYSADIGHHDHVWAPPPQTLDQGQEVRWVRFSTHEPTRVENLRAPNRGDQGAWEAMPVAHPPEIWPGRLAGRWYKTHPDVLFPDADVTIWIDASMEVTSTLFVRDAVSSIASARRLPGVASVAMFRHPDRTRIWEEVDAADTLAKYDGNRHAEMAAVHARVLGREPDHDLMAMGVIVRANDRPTRALDHLVWTETVAWSPPGSSCVALDQIILPFACDLLGDDVIPLEPPARNGCAWQGTLWSNDWFLLHDHRRET